MQGTLLGPANNNLRIRVNLRQAYDLSAKVGYCIKDLVLPYAKIGLSAAEWRSASTSTVLGNGSSKPMRFGVVAGVGVEFKIRNNFTMGAEYTYRHYSNSSHVVYNNFGQNMAMVKVQPTSSAFLIRLNLKFK